MVSMHGVDLGFLKSAKSKRALKKMRAEAEMERQQAAATAPEPARSDLFRGSVYVMPDINVSSGTFVSPIDGTVISSRSQLRAHNRRHGVDQIGNDYPFEKRHADMMARYGKEPDGQFKEKYREHMASVNAVWTDPGQQ